MGTRGGSALESIDSLLLLLLVDEVEVGVGEFREGEGGGEV